jgi:hypothetical protein
MSIKRTAREFRVIAVTRDNDTLAEFHHTEILKARAFAADMNATLWHVFNVSPERASQREPRTPRYRDTFISVDEYLWNKEVDALVGRLDYLLAEVS